MTETKDETPKRYPYDVERFKAIYAETLHERSFLWRLVGRLEWGLSSAAGLLAILLAPLIVFGTVFGIVYSLNISPFMFLAVFGALIGGLAFFVDRMVGGSLQFVDHSIWKRTLATVLGFSLAAGFILIFLFIGALHLSSFHLPW